MLLWEEALAAFRQYEEAEVNMPSDLLELSHQKAKW